MNPTLHSHVSLFRQKQTAKINVTTECLLVGLQLILFLTWLHVILGEATAKSVGDGNAERQSETVTWSLNVCLRAALSRLFSRGTVETWVVVNRASTGWWWWKPLVHRHPCNYPRMPISSLDYCLLQICSMDRWTDVSGGQTAQWVNSVSAGVPVAFGVVSGLCLNKAPSKSLRWRGARCLTRGPSVSMRRGQLRLYHVWMSVLVCCIWLNYQQYLSIFNLIFFTKLWLFKFSFS